MDRLIILCGAAAGGAGGGGQRNDSVVCVTRLRCPELQIQLGCPHAAAGVAGGGGAVRKNAAIRGTSTAVASDSVSMYWVSHHAAAGRGVGGQESWSSPCVGPTSNEVIAITRPGGGEGGVSVSIEVAHRGPREKA